MMQGDATNCPAATIPDTPGQPASARWYVILLLLVVLAGAALRWSGLGAQSLWFDEGYSAWVSSLPPAEIVRTIRSDVSPPLYYLLLHTWCGLFGDSEFALRAMSALAGTLSLLVFAAVCRQLLQNRSARLAAMALFALDVLPVQFSQEARSYGIAALFALLALWGMLGYLQRGSGGAWLVAALSAGISVWLHNMMWFYLAALNAAWLLAASRQSLRARLASLAALDALVVAAYLPWVPSLLAQMAWLKGNFWAPVPTPADLLQILSAVAGCKAWHLSRVLHVTVPGLAGQLWLGSAAAACMVLVALVSLRGEARRNAAAMATYALLPILAVFVHAQAGQSYFIEKIFTASAAAMPLALAAGLQAPRRHLAGALAVVLLGISCISVWGYFNWENKEEWRDAVALVNTQKPALVVFVANEGEYLYDYYTRRAGLPLLPRTGVPQGFFDLHPPRTIQKVRTDADLDRLRRRLDTDAPATLDLVWSHSDWSDPAGRVPQLLAARYGQQTLASFKDITLYSYSQPLAH